MRSVHIAKLHIRIPRAMAGQARDIARGLGNEILRGIAESTAAESGGWSVDALAAVRVRAGRTPEAAALQEQVAGQVTQQLHKRGGGGHG